MASSGGVQLRKILSLDGGGVRGLSSIIILKRIMRQYNENVHGFDKSQYEEPWQVFDMICGTSTGGIIAIMLGRLQMSLDQCEAVYLRLAEKVFTPIRNQMNPSKLSDFMQANPKYDHKILENIIRSELKEIAKRKRVAVSGESAVPVDNVVLESRNIDSAGKRRIRSRFGLLFKEASKDIVANENGAGNNDEDILLFSPYDKCKVFVCTIHEETGGARSTCLRSYVSDKNLETVYEIVKVWEAIRATSAASTFFEPISIGPYEERFVDGALAANNPIAIAKLEAGQLWPNDKPVIISIGTGLRKEKSLNGNIVTLAKRLADIAIQCDATYDNFVEHNLQMRIENRLFRFSTDGLEDVDLDEAGKKSTIAAKTNNYLNKVTTIEQLGPCKEMLSRKFLPATNSGDRHNGLTYIPFDRNRRYVTRGSVMDEIGSKLSSTTSCESVALWGLGGSGKTQVALEYAFQQMDKRPGLSIFWVPALSVDAFEAAYLGIGKLLQIPGIDEKSADVMTSVRDHLKTTTCGDWLLIVDNADDSKVIFDGKLARFLPQNHKGSILYTTRTKKLAYDLVDGQDSLIQIDKMSKPEAKDLLQKKLGQEVLRKEEVEVDRLLSTLTYLPLAIVQASAYIAHNSCSIAYYISKLEESDNTTIRLLEQAFRDPYQYDENSEGKPVAKTWLISFEQIRKDHPLAEEYLKFMACLLHKDIPQELLLEHDEIRQKEAIGTLMAYSFINFQESSQMFDMHRLVQISTRHWLKIERELSAWTPIVTQRIIDLLPDGVNDGKIWPKCLPHAVYIAESIERDETSTIPLELKSRLYRCIGNCHEQLRQHKASEIAYRVAFEINCRIFGTQDLKTLSVKRSLAWTLENQGNNDAAEILRREAIDSIKSVASKESLMAFPLLEKIIAIMVEENDAGNEKLLLEIISSTEKHTGVTALLLILKMRLGLLYTSQKKTFAVEKLFQELIPAAEQFFGSHHFLTLHTKKMFATALVNQNKLTEAKKIYLEILPIFEEKFGPENQDTIRQKVNLASLLHDQRQYYEAEKAFREVLLISDRVIGKETSETISLKHQFSTILRDQNKEPEAETMLQETLAICKNVFGPKAFETLSIQSDLGILFQHQGKLIETEEILSKTMLSQQQNFPESNKKTLDIRLNDASLLVHQERYDEAELFFVLQELAAARKLLIKFKRIMLKAGLVNDRVLEDVHGSPSLDQREVVEQDQDSSTSNTAAYKN